MVFMSEDFVKTRFVQYLDEGVNSLTINVPVEGFLGY